MEQCDTIKVKCTPCEGNEAGELTINARDYDPAIHVRVGDEPTTVVESDPLVVTSEPTPGPLSEPTPGPKPSRKNR